MLKDYASHQKRILAISCKGQITLPAAMRRHLGVHPGDQVSLTVQKGILRITKAPASTRGTGSPLGKEVT
jgi:AbrB family looped-hinge helix DNA binding protein